MNRYYSETGSDNQIISIECCIVEMFYVISEDETWWYNEQTSCLFANMFYNQKPYIISAHVLMIEASKLITYVKGHKWIDTINRFQWYNYEVYYIDLKWTKTEIILNTKT